MSVRTLDRVFSILRAFDGGGAGLGVTGISQQTGLHKSTVSRLLLALDQLEAVRRDPQTDKYWLGPEVVRLAHAFPFSDYLIAVARPFIAELPEVTRETDNFGLPDGDTGCMRIRWPAITW